MPERPGKPTARNPGKDTKRILKKPIRERTIAEQFHVMKGDEKNPLFATSLLKAFNIVSIYGLEQIHNSAVDHMLGKDGISKMIIGRYRLFFRDLNTQTQKLSEEIKNKKKKVRVIEKDTMWKKTPEKVLDHWKTEHASLIKELTKYKKRDIDLMNEEWKDLKQNEGKLTIPNAARKIFLEKELQKVERLKQLEVLLERRPFTEELLEARIELMESQFQEHLFTRSRKSFKELETNLERIIKLFQRIPHSENELRSYASLLNRIRFEVQTNNRTHP